MKLFKYFVYDMKLSRKMGLSYLIIIFLPMAMMFIWFQVHFVYQLEENTLNMEQVVTEQIAINVENYTSQMIQAAESIAQSEFLRWILSQPAEEFTNIMESEAVRDTALTFLGGIQAQIDGKAIQNICVYCEPESVLLSLEKKTGYGIFLPKEYIDTSLWYGKIYAEEDNEIMASTFFLNSWEIENKGQLSYVKKVPYYIQGAMHEAYIAVYFDRTYLTEVLDGYGSYKDSCIYIIDEMEGNVAQKGEGEYSRYILDYWNIDWFIKTEKKFEKIDYGEGEAWTIYRNLGKTGWKLVFSVSENSITGAVKEEGWIFMGIYLLIAVGLTMMMVAFDKSVSNRITALRDQMKQVKNEPPKVLQTLKCGDEIGELTESYNVMAVQANELLREQIQNEKERNQLEMNMLRSQINPHFLYNTLDMISWYAVKGNTEDVVSSIQALAQFYRLSLNNGDLLTTVGKEIRLLERYIELQNRRVACRVDLFVDIPDIMLEKKVLQFVLQPIVENSLKHGILEKDESEGNITITGWMEEKEMVLVLSDDGIGMTQEEVDAVLEKMQNQKAEEKNGHIGIQNIYRRLKLFYGNDGFSIKYNSAPGEGTEVELRLSYEIWEKEENN